MVTVDLFLQTRRRPPPPYEDFPAADFVWVGPKRRAGVLRKTAGSACGQVLPTCETHKLVHCCAKPVQRFVRYLRPPPHHHPREERASRQIPRKPGWSTKGQRPLLPPPSVTPKPLQAQVGRELHLGDPCVMAVRR